MEPDAEPGHDHEDDKFTPVAPAKPLKPKTRTETISSLEDQIEVDFDKDMAKEKEKET